MTKSFFAEFFEISANLARQIAESNGVSRAQIDLWIAQLSAGAK